MKLEVGHAGYPKFVFIAKHRTIWQVASLGDALGVPRSGSQSADYGWVTDCHPSEGSREAHWHFPYLRTEGVVLLQVGTAFVTPTEGQEYVPTDGAVTVPTGFPDVP
jgi:hypothetical protein